MKYLLTIEHIVTAEEANEPESRNLKAGETATSTLEVEDEAPDYIDNASVTITQAELDKHPELITFGAKVGDKVTLVLVQEEPETTNDAAFDLVIEAAIERVKKRYPDNKVFYVSSDNQVFLQANKQDAISHQKQIDQNREILPVSVD